MIGNSDLHLHLRVEEPVICGLPALAVLRIVNRGAEPVLVSARLNLMEGDVGLTVTGPSGESRELEGWQADTTLNRVSLPPGQQLVGALTLLETPQGSVFPEPGTYSITARYRPDPRSDPIASGPVRLEVQAAREGAEVALARQLADLAVRQSLLLGQADAAPSGLREIASAPGDSYASRLANLLVTEEEGSIPPHDVGHALGILALRTPFSGAAARLVKSLEAQRRDRDEDGDGGELSDLLNLRPLPAGEIGS